MCVVSATSTAQTYKISQRGNAAPGYVMISPAKSDTLGVIDNYGRAVFPVSVGMQINLASYKNRELSYFGVTNTGGVLGLACYVRMNAQQQITDSIYPVGQYQADFHEGFATSDTTFMILSMYRVKTDLSKYVQGGQTDAEVIGGVIQEISRSGRVLFEWKSLDHIPYSDATEDTDFTQSLVDVLHINSIYRDTDGGLILSCRHLDEIIKINGVTGKVVWRLGGSKSKNNQFRFLNDTTDGFFGFSHQHSVTRTSRGTLLVFDNGNLKPAPRKSRIVEYEVDEVAKTVRRVFEYSPAVSVYAATMGNVAELPNGNIFVGYGAALNLNGTASNIAAQEIDRAGNVVATVDNLPLPRINAYRILKTTYGMTGVQRTISATGTTEFATTDSTTCVTLQVASLKAPAVVTVEKHNYAPYTIELSKPGTLFYPPVRWAVRIDDTTSLTGSTKLRFENVRDVLDASTATLLYRPVEGSGVFSIITGTYSSAEKSWTIPFIKQGEFALGFSSKLLPELVYPPNGSVNVAERVPLRWSKLLFATTYELQVSRDSAFLKDVSTYTVTDTTFTPAALRNNTTFWWRVRKRNSQGVSVWSSVWKFRSEFNSPQIIEPDTSLRPAIVTQESIFRWKQVQGASMYNVVVRDSAGGVVLLDTLLNDTVCAPVERLPANRFMVWSVTAEIDSSRSAPSPQGTIASVPKRPSLISPEPNVYIPATVSTVLRWAEDQEIASYRVRMIRSGDGAPLVDTTVRGTSCTVTNLVSGTRYTWTCAAEGRYGQSLISGRSFTVAESSSLGKPVIEETVQRHQLPHQVPTTCSWLPVQRATTYHVQVAEDVVFDNPVIDTVVDATSAMILFSRPSALYAWRVQARNGFDIGPWSDTVFATTRIDSNVILTPVYPLHGTVSAKDNDIFRFVTSPIFTGFEVVVSQDPRFSNIDYKYYCFVDSTAYSFLQEGTRYYWKITGTTAAGQNYVSQTSTMVVNTNVGVNETACEDYGIEVTHTYDGIRLYYKGLANIESVAVYSLLGERLGGRSGFPQEMPILLDGIQARTCFIVVTFLTGKAYFMRAN